MMDRQLPYLLITWFVFGSIACGDNPSTDGEQTKTVNPEAPDIRSLRVKVSPTTEVYRTGAKLTFDVVAYGPEGSKMESTSQVDWNFEPASAVKKAGDRTWELVEESEITVQACTPAKRGEICGDRILVVDDGPPMVRITSPKAGAMIRGSEDNPRVAVEGKIDASDAAAVFVNGQSAKLNADGTFRTWITPGFGVNHLEVVTFDGHYAASIASKKPDIGKDALDFIWAPTYRRVESGQNDVRASYADAVKMRLGQSFFDDGSPLKMPQNSVGERSTGAYRFGDIADLVELMAREVDYQSNLSNPLISRSNIELGLNNIEPGQVDVSFDILDDGAELFLRFSGLAIETSGWIELDGQQFSLDGSVRVSPSAVVSLNIGQNREGNVSVSLRTSDISLGELRGQFPSSDVNLILDVSSSLLRSSLEEVVANQIKDRIIRQVPGVIEGALREAETKLADQTRQFTVPKVNRDIRISLDGSIENLSSVFKKQVTGTFGLSTGVGPVLESSPTGKGVPVSTTGASKPAFLPSSKIQIGLKLSLINGLLYQLWETGFFDMDLLEAGLLPSNLSGQFEEARLLPGLPPMILPPAPTSAADFELVFGQLELRVAQKNAERVDHYAVYLKVGVNLSLGQDQLKLQIPNEPVIRDWVKDTTKEQAMLGDLGRIIKTHAWYGRISSSDEEGSGASLKERLTSGMTFSLPILNPAASLSRLDPTFSNIAVDLSARRPLLVQDGWIVFDRSFGGTF